MHSQKWTLSIQSILGDPTCDSRWIDFLKKARLHKNIKQLRAFTNAVLLHKIDNRELLTSGITLLNISTSLKDRESYSRLYGIDRYDQTLSNIISICKANKELNNPVDIKILLRMDKPFADFYHSEPYLALTKYISSKAFSVLEEYDDYNGLVTAEDLPKGTKFIGSRSPNKDQPCYALYRTLQVLYDGTIQPCICRINRELWAGNIMEYNTIEDAWKNERFEKLRNDWWNKRIPDFCEACSHYLPMSSLIKAYKNERLRNKTFNYARRRLSKIKRVIAPH